MPHFTLKPDLSITSIGNEVVLLDLTSGQYFGLNDVGSVIIEALKLGQSLNEIADHLVNTFEVTKDQALSDTQTLLNQLESANLLRADEAHATP